MRLYLIRHPRPVIAADVCYGSSDIAVAPPESERVANELVASLGSSTLLPRGLPICSSPLRRCAGLAQQLFIRLDGASLSFDPRLEEMHFGAWELRGWEDIARDEVDAWAQDVVAYRPGGGECVMDMAQRVDAFYQAAQAAGGDRIVVCHAGTIRLLFACRQGGPASAIAQRAGQARLKIDYGQLMTLDG